MKKLAFVILLLFGINKISAQFTGSSFALPITVISGTGSTSNPQGIIATDLDGDGKKDLVISNNGNNSISVFRNIYTTGTLSSSSFSSKTDYNTAVPVNVLNSADLDGDGKPDISMPTTSTSVSQFSLYRDSSSLGNVNLATRVDITSNTCPTDVRIADIDGDGKNDLIAFNYGSNNISIFRNISSIGTFTFAPKIDFATGTNPGVGGVGDIDGDGKIDIVVPNYNGASITVFRNTTIGITFSFTTTTLVTPALPNFVKIEDIDGDGKKDVMTSNYNGNNISIFRNTTPAVGTISFASRVDIATGSGSSAPQGSVIEDLDGDGKKDIAVANRLNNTFSIFKNIGTPGTFNSSSLAAQVTFATGNSPCELIAADFDADGRLDLAVSNNVSSNSIYIYRNQIITTAPTIGGSTLSYSNVGNNNMTLTFSKGDGARRIVLCKQGSGVSAAPISGTLYTANSVFASGSQIGTGNYVVYSDTGSTFTLSGLNANTNYYFAIFEYNGVGGFANYLTTAFSYITGSQATSNTIYYFSKSTGNLNTLSTWGTATDGSGTAPVSFSTPNSYYYIFNNPAPTMSANLTITGGNTALVVGDGVNTYNFSIPSGFTLTTDTLVVKKFATLTVNGTLAGTSNIFEDTSTAQFTGASAQNIPTASYYNLVTSSAVKTMLGNVVVRNNFVMMSNVNMNSYAMMLGTSASLRGNLNRISGTLYGGTLIRWFTNATNTGSTGLFPIGTSTDYRPVQIDYTTAPTSGGSLSAAFVTTSPSQTGLPFFDFNTASSTININAIGSNGTWQLSPSTLSGGQFTGFFTASAFTGVSSYADLRLVRRASSGSAWSTTGISQAATGSNAIPVVSRTGMTLFGEFGIGGDVAVNALPVKIIILSVQQNSDFAMLKWETASELNSDHFEILRSVDDIDWTSLGKVASAGNSNEIRKYAFADDIKSLINRETKTIYYQLKQVDKDGSVAYSNIITVNLKTATNAVTLYPLPISNILHAVSNNGETVIGVSLFDISGKELITTTNGKMDVSTLAEGVYIAKVTTDRDVYYQKITK